MLASAELPHDFIQYWAVGRLLWTGENPYDAALQLREQRHAYPQRDIALMMWNPPPALALYAPWGLLPPWTAAVLWNGLQLVAVVAAAFLLVQVYAPSATVWWFLPLTLGFVGTWWLLFYGQNTGWILLGLAGFVWGQHRQRPLLAGCCGALTILKPHLLLAFGLLWLTDLAYKGRPRMTVLAGLGLVAATTGLALGRDPAILTHFIQALQTPSPYAIPLASWMLPTASYWLRIWLVPDSFLFQFVPAVITSVVLLVWKLKQGSGWSWPETLPLVVAVSVLTTGYGGWIFDLPVLLVPVIAIAARLLRWGYGTAFFLVTIWQLSVTLTSLYFSATLHGFWWVAPAVLGPAVLLPFLGLQAGSSSPPGSTNACPVAHPETVHSVEWSKSSLGPR
ncbi:MAG: DUF2029 domain-containing protein [Gemmataceae bacterium]|nr:DUF2029 domain-containing protein [Gemmataceae bacterium]MDW8241893.1 glycosyltransferase family 87 protein [Thermogemmata sp.]